MNGNMEYLLSEERQREVRNPRLDASNRVFDPKQFIKESLAHVSYQALEQQLVDEVGEEEAKTREALKDLIRDNLGTFIGSKDAMDHVYNTDNSLFSGEALGGILDAFDDARVGCEDLVAPTQDLHEEMIRNRKSQDMLEKLYSVLRVPGVLYACCGVRVALRRSTVEASRLRDESGSDEDHPDADGSEAEQGQSRKRVHNDSEGADDEGDDEEDEHEEDEEDEDDDDDNNNNNKGRNERGSRAALDGTVRELHGALESSSPATGPGGVGGGAGDKQRNDFLIGADEEVFYWYATPLVRLRDAAAQRARVEDTGNLEGAVIHVRRAMLYLEETYDLLKGKLKGDASVDGARDDEGGAGVRSRASSVSGTEEDHESQQHGANANSGRLHSQDGSAGKSAFVFRLSMALLRASLYLLEQLADELVRCSASDTVLIEDTLSMMMDVSIATVKLSCFCEALLPGLGQRNMEALASLRSQLVVQSGEQGDDAQLVETPRGATGPHGWGEAGASPVTGMSFASSSASFAVAGSGGRANGPSFSASPAVAVSTMASPVTALAQPANASRRVQRHPVQFFIKVTGQEHNRLMLASAIDLLQEANDWGRKASAHTQLQSEASIVMRKAAASAVAGEGGYDAFDSNSLTDGLFGGVINDSFSSSFLFNSSAQATAAAAADRGAGSNVNSSGSGSSFVAAAGFSAPADAPTGNNSGDTAAASAAATAAEAREKRTADGLNQNAEADILHAFRTPEASFDTYTTIRIGAHDMTTVLEYSCAQVYLHSKSMLGQLLERSDTEANIMAQGPLLNTFAARLLQSSVDNLEHVLVSYWGGIATTIHAGVFDFKPEPGSTLAAMLDLVFEKSSAHAPADTATAAVSSPLPPTRDGEMASSTATQSNTDAEGHPSEGRAVPRVRVVGSGDDNVPQLRYLPTLCEAALPSELREVAQSAREAKASGKYPASSGRANASQPTPSPDAPAAVTLRDLSMYTVRHMIRSASSIVSSVFLAFVNRSVVAAFVRSLSQYTAFDVRQGRTDELVELHAATLVEVLLGQWERMMTGVSGAVLRMKVALGESCTQATIASEAQLAEVAELLEELEQLRSTCLRCYLHGVGMLAKAYVTALPLLSSASASEEDGESGLENRIRARLSREFVSTRLSNKLLNTLAVVVDRISPLLRRHTEVFDSADLFAAKAEDMAVKSAATGGDDGAGRARASRRRVLRRRRRDAAGGGGSARTSRAQSVAGSLDEERNGDGSGLPAGFEARVDPVTQMVAEHHSRLVQAHLSEHEALIQALVSNILLVFVDTLHQRSHGLCSSPLLADGDKEQGIVESIADTLALPTATAPTFVEHILQPAILEQLVLLTPEAVSVQDRQVLLANKVQQFYQVYLAVVSEHCQLAVDAMVGMYLSIPQQFITNEVRRSGFMAPLFDWQRASAQTSESVRPYIANCIVRIAEAGETLHWIRQPALGVAVTQRLVAHLAVAFVTALNVDITPFEMSAECSPDFLTYGTLLLEAEALSIVEVVHAVLTAGAGPGTGSARDVQPELLLAEELLRSTANTMIQFGNQACEVLAAASAAASAAAGGGGSSVDTSARPLTIAERVARRNALVGAANRASRFMVAAIRTHMDEASLATSATSYKVAGQGQSLIERLAKRREGYEATAPAKTGRTTRTKKKVVKKHRETPAPSTGEDATGDAKAPAVRTVRRPTPIQVSAGGGTGAETPPLPASPATPNLGVTFRLDQEQEAHAATSALLSAGTGSILTSARQPGEAARPRRVVRRRAKPEEAEDGDGDAGGSSRHSSRRASRTQSRLERTSASDRAQGTEGVSRRAPGRGTTAEGTAAAPRRARLARGTAAGSSAGAHVGFGGGDDDAEPAGAGVTRREGGLEGRAAARRERRARRFGRENAM